MLYPAAVNRQTSRAIRESMGFSAVVDIDGVGGFWTVQDAIDAGHKSIFVRDGTYPPFHIDVSYVGVEGESKLTIIDGAEIDHAIYITKSQNIVRNLRVQTTAGGGGGFSGILVGTPCANLNLDGIHVFSSDAIGIYIQRPGVSVRNCFIQNCDSTGVYLDAGGDDSRIVNNDIRDCGGWGTGEDAAAENCLYVANRVTGNASGQIQQASGTGVYVGNDET